MENIFRFVLVRPAVPSDDDVRVSLARRSRFQTALAAAHDLADARARMIAVATDYATSTGIARSYKDLEMGPQWSALADYLAQTVPPSLAGTIAEVSTIFGHSPEALSTDARFSHDDERAADSVVAVKIAPQEQRAGFGVMPTVLRLAELIRASVRHHPGATNPKDALEWTMIVPPSLFPLPETKRQETSTTPATAPEVDALRTRIASSQRALEELMGLEATTVGIEDQLASSQVADPTIARVARTAPPRELQPGGAPTQVRRRDAFALTTTAAAALSRETHEVLTARAVNPTALSLDRIVNGLSRAINIDVRRLAQLEVRRADQIRMIGTSAIAIPRTERAGAGTGLALARPAWALPTSRGSIHSVGIADLLTVKQQLKRYERIDIAHIENVLKGESMKREHVTSSTSEQFTLLQTTDKTEQEQDLESTDRFEMSRQVTETLQQDASLQAGLTISGSYGPTVDFSASVQDSVHIQKSETTAQATKYSRDVTSRTAKKVSEEVLRQSSLRVTTNVTDTNVHAIDNAKGTGHIVGVYQWLDKVYEAQVYNYGLRALFDFTVSEPAALTIAAMKSKYADATELRKPSDFNVTPEMLDETNYAAYLLEWEASGASPPPAPYVTVAKVFKGGADTEDSPTRGEFIDAAALPIPDGYRAVFVTVSRLFNWWEQSAYVDVVVGGVGQRLENYGPWTWNASLDGEVGAVGIAVKTYQTDVYALSVEVRCESTTRAKDRWRHDIYNILLGAYQKLESAYEDKLAALQARVGVEIAGRNPGTNRQLEKTELKRACIAILTAQNFTGFGSVAPGPDGLPDLDFAKQEIEGPYVRFFEQAFEWENLTYVFYPYFWSRRETWLERMNYDDVDPTFSSFLAAGSARVVAPVRPGFELALDHFLQTGQIWNGGALPAIGQELYVPIIDELRASLGAPGTEVAQGEPWDVRIPTNLVKLRDDSSLPLWTKQADGSWIDS